MHHYDPFDRLLVPAVLVATATIPTPNAAIQEYAVSFRWKAGNTVMSWNRTFRCFACRIQVRGRRHRDSQAPSLVAVAGQPERMVTTPTTSNRRPTAASAASIRSSSEPWFRSSTRSTGAECEFRRGANSGLLNLRVAHRAVEHHLRDLQRRPRLAGAIRDGGAVTSLRESSCPNGRPQYGWCLLEARAVARLRSAWTI